MVHNAQPVSADRLQRKLIAGIALTGILTPVIMDGFKMVEKHEFDDFIYNPSNDFVISLEGGFPYAVNTSRRNGEIVAKEIPIGKHFGISTDQYEYYLRNK